MCFGQKYSEKNTKQPYDFKIACHKMIVDFVSLG